MNTAQQLQRTNGDFDFLFGTWKVHHHRLDRRLVGETQWTDFEGTCRARPLLGGLGNLDENVLDLPSGRYEAATVRLYDAERKLWSIWWIDARNPAIDSPMQGAFVDGVGTFYAEDVHDGIPIRVRFVWSEITPISASWQQAFSVDAGTTWETNWTMRFERVA
jgi:hypothetical protein